MLGEGAFSDLGTDLDAAFDLVPGAPGSQGFDPDFFKIPGIDRDKPRNGGQYGVTLLAILSDQDIPFQPEGSTAELADLYAESKEQAQ